MPWANPPCPKASSWAAWASCKHKPAFQTTPNSHKPSAHKNSLDAISRLFCYVETLEYLSDSRIRPTFSDDSGLRSSEKIETPDTWGKSSDDVQHGLRKPPIQVLIPDEWGKSSDEQLVVIEVFPRVLIPDEWGRFSDIFRRPWLEVV